MKLALGPLGLPALLALLTGCYSYTEPELPRNVQPVTQRGRQMAANGLNMTAAATGRWQRSGMSGTSGDVDDDEAKELQLGMPELAFAEGLGGPGFGNTLPQADLDAPNELRNGQARGVVFRPSDHYFINGVDTGPSVDAMRGTGGPGKLKLQKLYEGRELKASELMVPMATEPTKPTKKR
jgi:hypothetical protein